MIKDNKLTIDNINHRLINQVNVENETNKICEIKDYSDKTSSYLKNDDQASEKSSYGIKNFMKNTHLVNSIEYGEITKHDVLSNEKSINYENKTSNNTFNEINQAESRCSSFSFHSDINDEIMVYVNNISKGINSSMDYEVGTYNNLSNVHILNNEQLHEREGILGDTHSKQINLSTHDMNVDTNGVHNVNSNIIEKKSKNENNQDGDNHQGKRKSAEEDDSSCNPKNNNHHILDSTNCSMDSITNHKHITSEDDKSLSRHEKKECTSIHKNEETILKKKNENIGSNIRSINKDNDLSEYTKEETQMDKADVVQKRKKSELFKNYSHYEIMNVLCNYWNKEILSSEFFYPHEDVKKFDEKSHYEHHKNEMNNVDMGVVAEGGIGGKVRTNDDPNSIERKNLEIDKHIENSNRLTKKKEEILQLLLKNLSKNEIDNINKNLLFLKRMQKYFYQKYINIRFPNDLSDHRYFLHLDWFNKLKSFIFSENGEYPGCISNYKLYDNIESLNLSDNNYMINKKDLKTNLKEGKDYICINQYMWRFLHFIFRGGPCVKRYSNNIYDRYVPVSNSDIMNKNIIYLIEPKYVDNLFSSFNYSNDELLQVSTDSKEKSTDEAYKILSNATSLSSSSSISHPTLLNVTEKNNKIKQCAHNYYEFLHFYEIKEKEYNSSFYLEYDQSNPKVMNKMIELKNKNSYESLYSFYSNEDDILSRNDIIHNANLSNIKTDSSELIKKQNIIEKEKMENKLSVDFIQNQTKNMSLGNIDTIHGTSSSKVLARVLNENVKNAYPGNDADSTGGGMGGNNNNDNNDGKRNSNNSNNNNNSGSGSGSGSSRNNNNNSNNNNSNSNNNNSNNSNSNSNNNNSNNNNNNSNNNNNNNNNSDKDQNNDDKNNDSKNSNENEDSSKNKKNSNSNNQEEQETSTTAKLKEAKETTQSSGMKRENQSDNNNCYFGPKARVGSPSILSSNYTHKNSNLCKTSNNKMGNSNINHHNNSDKVLLAPPPKKNSLGFYSSNGNEIYKSCEEYNADNGDDASSNGYLTTSETDSKGTTDSSVKSAAIPSTHKDKKNKDDKNLQHKDEEQDEIYCKKESIQKRNISYRKSSMHSSDISDGNDGSNGSSISSGAIPKKVSTEKDGSTTTSKRDKRKEEYEKNFHIKKQPDGVVAKKGILSLNNTLNHTNLMLKERSNYYSNSSSSNGSSNRSSSGSSNRSSNGSSNRSSSGSSNFSIRNQSTSNRSTYNDKKHMKNMMAPSNLKRESNFNNNSLNIITMKEQPAGLVNYSATCYINVVLQCLAVYFKLIYTLHNYVTMKYKNLNFSSEDTDNMNSSFINKNFFTNSIPFNLFGNNNKKKDECLLIALSQKLFQLSKMHNKGKVLNVNKLLSLLNDKYSYLFEYNEQQDCHEFLLLLFDFIHNMTKVVDENVDKNNKIDYCLKKEQSVISDLFLGLIEEKITCSQCNYVNYIYQPIYNLSVNVFKKNPENNLNDNLVEYFKKEEVNSTCEKCKCKKMFKESCVYKQPKILIVHLIRLLEDGSKIDNPIKFDVNNFTIQNVLKKKNSQYIENPKKYNLCGVIVHRGLNSNYGHYICYTKRRHSNGATVWHKFDDSIVTVVDVSEVESAKAYCLFYESQ
ncbi:ubiquitin carboxyl-terminal hydrolase [Plasmodium gonderi]|uniref:Ubiquitin carboxyl-terminal hydrolase n=1 Tax=Plasmodium gonderi TaxID=77519 RepID=A0A1Y1JCZ5_PLAGO|nr:ubiquitin carboxyl-terminal hydrolase [Plasmodium gonderi]GAW80110.1 ubiquitin carboxyl-terminal hydrolase [Plasmodium gonderi]